MLASLEGCGEASTTMVTMVGCISTQALGKGLLVPLWLLWMLTSASYTVDLPNMAVCLQNGPETGRGRDSSRKMKIPVFYKRVGSDTPPLPIVNSQEDEISQQC